MEIIGVWINILVFDSIPLVNFSVEGDHLPGWKLVGMVSMIHTHCEPSGMKVPGKRVLLEASSWGDIVESYNKPSVQCPAFLADARLIL